VSIFDFLFTTLVNKSPIQPQSAAIDHILQLLMELHELKHGETPLDLCQQHQILSKSVMLRDVDLDSIKEKLQKQHEQYESMLNHSIVQHVCFFFLQFDLL
jgi:hypothetical protein